MLRLVSVTPAANSTARQRRPRRSWCEFNGPLKSGSPSPVITPAVPRHLDALAATSAIFTPGHRVRAVDAVHDPDPGGGIQARAGAAVRRHDHGVHFTTGGYSRLRLGQLLSQLGYLPMTWSPATEPGRPARSA